MTSKVYQLVSVTRVVVMLAFLSTIFWANVNPLFAASENKKSPVTISTSAADHTEARIKELQDTLKITKAQEAPWDNLIQLMRENAEELDAFTKDTTENINTLNAVEQMKLHSQITETRLNQMKRFLPPFEEFYNSMSYEQKKKADTIFQKGIMKKQNKRK